MWTICYRKDDKDYWDRLSKEDLVEFIKANLTDEDGFVDEDILIFAPESEYDISELGVG